MSLRVTKSVSKVCFCSWVFESKSSGTNPWGPRRILDHRSWNRFVATVSGPVADRPAPANPQRQAAVLRALGQSLPVRLRAVCWPSGSGRAI